MKTKYLKVFNLIVAFLIVLLWVGRIFAWFAEGVQNRQQKFGGSSASAYFAGGTGTKNDPFILTNKFHVYNLAWLQDTGSFGEDKYYFAVENDIRMDDMWVPPIGTDDNPFISEFDGRGHSITGLKVTTNRNKLTSCPVIRSETFKFSRAVGFFGYTDNKSSDDKSKIQNFILDNPFVEVAIENAPYSNESNLVAGLAVGHVAGVVNSIGIRAIDGGTQTTGMEIYVASENLWYSTFNSILGELAEGATSSVTGGGAGGNAGGAGGNYGNTLDTSILLDRLKNISALKYNARGEPITTSWRLPNVTQSGNNWTLAKGEKLSVAAMTRDRDDPNWNIDSYWNIFYNKSNQPYEEVASDNTGYFLGEKTEITTSNIKFGGKLKLSPDGMRYVATDKDGNYITDEDGNLLSPYAAGLTPLWFYTQPNSYNNSDYTTQHGFAPVKESTYENLPSGITDLIAYAPYDPAKPNEPLPSFTFVTEQVKYTTALPWDGEYRTLGAEDWSYHGQIIWDGQPYGVGLKSDPYNTEGFSDAINADERGNIFKYTYNGLLFDDNNYWLNDDCTYVINIDGWNASVRDLDASGYAIYIDDDRTYYYYIDGNLIDENNYLFNFDKDGRKVYVSGLEGWALPIYYVDSEGYAIDMPLEDITDDITIHRYNVEGFYELDENNFYKRINGGSYVIKTPNWNIPIYVIDENGYALTGEGGLYYTTIPNVYQKDGTYKYYDANGNPLILVGGQYIVPDGDPNRFDSNGFAINKNGYWYTATTDSYLMYENGTYYLVDANGNKQIKDKGGVIATPDAFDTQGYAMAYDEVNDRYYYYNTTDNNIFYHKINGKYYHIRKSAEAGNIWTYVADGSSAIITNIDANGYAMSDIYGDGNLYYVTTTDKVYQDSQGYVFHVDDGYYLYGDTSTNWIFAQVGYFGEDGILYANSGLQSNNVRGRYYTDTNGYVITLTGAYELYENNEINWDSNIPYSIDSGGNITYSDGAHKNEQVIIRTADNGNSGTFKALNNGAWNNGHKRIQVDEGGSDSHFAKAEIGSANDRLQQAQGTLDDRVQATHDSEFPDVFLTVKFVEDDDEERPLGVKLSNPQTRPFHQMMGGIYLPNNGIWFKPSKAGMIRFVMYADTPNQNFALLKIERQRHADGTPSFDDTLISITDVLHQTLPANVMFYYEHEVSQADIDAGNIEFVIMCYDVDVGGSHLLYLDIGASALVGDGEDVSTVNPDVDVSAVDFIYEDVQINQLSDFGNGINVGDFIVGTDLYEATKTRIFFEQIQSTLKIAFVRLANQADGVTINVTATDLNDNQLGSGAIKSSRSQYSRINGS